MIFCNFVPFLPLMIHKEALVIHVHCSVEFHWPIHNLFMHSSKDGHWGCFGIFTRINTVTMNKRFSSFVPGAILWVTGLCASLTLLEAVKLFARMVGPISPPTGCVWEFVHHSHQQSAVLPLLFTSLTGVKWHFTGFHFAFPRLRLRLNIFSNVYQPFVFPFLQIAYIFAQFSCLFWKLICRSSLYILNIVFQILSFDK